MPSFGTLTTHFLAFVVGAVAAGYVVANNKNKAFAALSRMHDAAQAEISRLRSK